MPPPQDPAANLLPSAEETMDVHSLVGAPVKLQVAPELVEVKMPPSLGCCV